MAKQSNNKSFTPYHYATIALAVVVVVGGLFIWQMNISPKDEVKESVKETTKVPSTCRAIKDQQVCDTDYLGLDEADAMSKANSKGLRARVVERNGVGLTITQDFNPARLNFTIAHDKVSKLEFY